MEVETGMCSIDELPDELLVAIAAEFQVERGYLVDADAEEGRRSRNAVIVYSLHALALCCRRLNAIATPSLYQCIIQTKRLMPLLIPTLLHNPHLGQHIQYIEITDDEHGNAEMYTWKLFEGFDQPTRDKYLERMKSAKWIVPTCDFVADATVQAEQNSPTNGLSRISESTLRWIQQMIKSKTKDSLVVLLSLADNLQDVAIENNINQGYMEILALTYFARPDAFRRLWVCSDYYQGCRWSWTNRISPDYDVELPQIHHSLSKFQDSLTRLTIDTTDLAPWGTLSSFVPALGSLRSFKVLAFVEVTALVLWGEGDFWDQGPLSELLPESIEHLILKTEWDEDIEEKLDQMSSECTTYLPKLKKVECTWRPASGFIADLLIDACRLAGVDLRLSVEESQDLESKH
ncbi:hypothetical protein C7974DRAFT_439465 [Boeremia exigua]|uniref:uncharacterized protein n=1 Tax=Boeremia exigua TaxID=749465 RepID=UPI001E8DC2EF|nr:uncharacterized protein C7974DRAFT_439465 [Boeremia exigua]KAH6644197.1 hypothetical protein C7974DRAFT_439465 [Boeremia exigua]